MSGRSVVFSSRSRYATNSRVRSSASTRSQHSGSRMGSRFGDVRFRDDDVGSDDDNDVDLDDDAGTGEGGSSHGRSQRGRHGKNRATHIIGNILSGTVGTFHARRLSDPDADVGAGAAGSSFGHQRRDSSGRRRNTPVPSTRAARTPKGTSSAGAQPNGLITKNSFRTGSITPKGTSSLRRGSGGGGGGGWRRPSADFRANKGARLVSPVAERAGPESPGSSGSLASLPAPDKFAAGKVGGGSDHRESKAGPPSPDSGRGSGEQKPKPQLSVIVPDDADADGNGRVGELPDAKGGPVGAQQQHGDSADSKSTTSENPIREEIPEVHIPTLQEQVVCQCRLLVPTSRRRMAWDLMLVVFVMWNLIILPVDLAFNVQEGLAWNVLESCIDLIFITDVVLNFMTPYLERDGGNFRYVTDLRDCSIHYLKTWFVLDFVSSIPIDLFFLIIAGTNQQSGSSGGDDSQSSNVDFLKAAKIGRLMKNIRLLRLGRLVKLVGSSFAGEFSNVWRIFRLFLLFFVVAHLAGCFFYFVSDYAGIDDASTAHLVLYSKAQESWAWQHGIHSLQGDDSSQMKAHRYLVSTYTALLLLLGQTTDPQTDSERGFVMFVMMGGAMIHAALFGQMALLISNFNRAGSRYQSTMDAVNEHVRNLGLEHSLATRIQEYFEFEWYLNRCLDRNEFIATLSPTLQDEVCVVVTGDMVVRVPFLERLETPCLVEIVKCLVTTLYLHADYIVFEGRIGSAMYFIREGHCDVLKNVNADRGGGCERLRSNLGSGDAAVGDADQAGAGKTGGNKKSEREENPVVAPPVQDLQKTRRSGRRGSAGRSIKKVFTLREGDYFGELAMLLPNQKRTATVRAQTNADLLMLRREDFLRVIREFPESLGIIKEVVNEQLAQYTTRGAALKHKRMSQFGGSVLVRAPGKDGGSMLVPNPFGKQPSPQPRAESPSKTESGPQPGPDTNRASKNSTALRMNTPEIATVSEMLGLPSGSSTGDVFSASSGGSEALSLSGVKRRPSVLNSETRVSSSSRLGSNTSSIGRQESSARLTVVGSSAPASESTAASPDPIEDLEGRRPKAAGDPTVDLSELSRIVRQEVHQSLEEMLGGGGLSSGGGLFDEIAAIRRDMTAMKSLFSRSLPPVSATEGSSATGDGLSSNSFTFGQKKRPADRNGWKMTHRTNSNDDGEEQETIDGSSKGVSGCSDEKEE